MFSQKENLKYFSILRYWRFAKREYFLGVFVTMVYSLLQPIILFYSGFVIEIILEFLTVQVLEKVIISLSILGIIIIFRYLFHVLLLWYSGLFAVKTTKKIRLDIFEALQYQSQKWYKNQNTGDLVSKSTADLFALERFFIGVQMHIPGLVADLFIYLVLLYIININFFLIGLVSIPFFGFIAFFFEKKNSPLLLQSRNEFGKLNTVLQECIDGIKVSKIFNANKKNNSRFDIRNSSYRQKNKKSIFLQAITTRLNLLMTGILVCIMLLFGGLLYINGDLRLGLLISTLMIMSSLTHPLYELIDFTRRVSGFKASSCRIQDILEDTPEILESPDALPLNSLGGEITFRNVNFRYGKEPILNNINLFISANEKIGLIGGTGSGKTSLINLIIRFYDVEDGCVKIDGIDVKKLQFDSLRRGIGFVDQETFLFSKSIRENICFGKFDATDEEIERVAKIAHIHTFIDSLPEKYNTIIGERGVTLSGGQKQRLSIARAILTDPKIIIFDDSLSAVDIRTEHEIQRSLHSIFKEKTVIYVTQRLSILSSVDKIVIMDKGKIIEQGHHSDLVNTTDSIYRSLYLKQIDDLIDLSMIRDHETLGVVSHE
ncbi:MAG: ABC transporter ATP-binding protein [Promethearchaeota archaeon]